MDAFSWKLTRAHGSPGFVVVNPAEVERGLRQDVGAQISEVAVGDLGIHMRTVMRKIGLNPTVFMSARKCESALLALEIVRQIINGTIK